MDSIEITASIILRVWWAYAWRAFLGGCAIGFVIGLLAGAAVVLLRLDKSLLVYANVLSIPVGFFWSIYAFKLILVKDFGDFKISLTRPSEGLPVRS